MGPKLRIQIIHAVAFREGTARQLAERFSMPVEALRAFVAEHEDSIRGLAEQAESEAYEDAEPPEDTPDDIVPPEILDELWISKKSERLRRYQAICDRLYLIAMAEEGRGIGDATTLRELRSFMRYAAEELGQLLHRGSGEMNEGSTVSYTLPGVDMEDLK